MEGDRPNPLSVYARSKYEGEGRVLNSGALACVLRTAWLYGEHGSNFVEAILAAAAHGRPLRVVADQVGSPTATADLARAIAEILARPVVGLFHMVNAGFCSRYESDRWRHGRGGASHHRRGWEARETPLEQLAGKRPMASGGVYSDASVAGRAG